MIQADYELASELAGDDELLQLEIRSPTGPIAPGETLHLRCAGVMHTRVRIFDATGRIVPQRLGAPEIYDLPPMPASGPLPLALQVRTIAGAPFGRLSSLNRAFQGDGIEDSRFTIILMRRDPMGTEHEEDEGRFSVAPFIIADSTAPARRVYMVSDPTNLPSLTDVQLAVRAAGVPLVTIDHRLCGGDRWVQDQYQHSFMQGANGWRELVLHLPRLRHENTNATITDNLEDVVNTHFRSADVGVFDGLWDRVLSVRGEGGVAVQASFRDLDTWVKQARQITSAHRMLDLYGSHADGAWSSQITDDWVDALLDLDSRLLRFNHVNQAARARVSQRESDRLEDEQRAAAALVAHVTAQFPISDRGSADPIIGSTIAGQPVRLRGSTIRQLYHRVDQMHSSANYGGNIESTPAVAGAPLGKILLGSVRRSGASEFVDPDLLRVLVHQRKQPIVEIDTSWLEVGHVDEVVAVVPSSRASGGFALLHASSLAAIELLREARARYQAGLPADHPHRRGHDRLRPSMLRRMDAGSSPVTRLFRGKAWLHVHRPQRPGHVAPDGEPPAIYYRLCEGYGSTTTSSRLLVPRIGYVPGQGADRRYPADITAHELLWAEADGQGRSCNAGLDASVLERCRAALRDALPGIAIVPIPVIFDRTHDIEAFQQNPGLQATTAFSPDMVNLQVINGHLLIPRPYGPRMRVDDAIAVVRDVMARLDMPEGTRARVGRRLIATGQMTRGAFWVEKVSPAYLTTSSGTILASYGGMVTEQDVIEAFRDSFPGAGSSELERRIVQPHRRHFDTNGYLRRDFTFGLFRIEDGMVDLFELYVAAVAADLGVRLHFVDSWDYHLLDGQIHCGTNVLRGPPPRRAGTPNVWDAPDHGFRTLDFEDEVVGGAR